MVDNRMVLYRHLHHMRIHGYGSKTENAANFGQYFNNLQLPLLIAALSESLKVYMKR